MNLRYYLTLIFLIWLYYVASQPIISGTKPTKTTTSFQVKRQIGEGCPKNVVCAQMDK